MQRRMNTPLLTNDLGAESRSSAGSRSLSPGARHRYTSAYLRRVGLAREQLTGRKITRDVAAQLGVRNEVVMSWQRSALSGLRFGELAPRYRPTAEKPGVLAEAAQPVLERLTSELDGCGIICALFDRDGNLIHDPVGDSRSCETAARGGLIRGVALNEELAGTNGVGCSLEINGPFVTVGTEHYWPGLDPLATAGFPIRDRMTRRLLGLFGFVMYIENHNDLIVPYGQRIVADIEQRVFEGKSATEHRLFDQYIRTRRRTGHPVIAFGKTMVFRDDVARSILADADEDVLRHIAFEAVAAGHVATEFPLSEGRVVSGMCVPADDSVSGVVIELTGAPHVQTVMGDPAAPTDGPTLRRKGPAGPNGASGCLYRGEPGTGKTTRAAADGALRIDAALAAPNPAAWLQALTTACNSSECVVVQHLDEIPTTMVRQIAAVINAGTAVVHATAGPDIAHVDAMLPLVGQFSSIVDLYPLSERLDEIPHLVTAILDDLSGSTRMRCNPAAMSALLATSWPDNVRQLRLVLSAACNRADDDVIDIEDLPAGLVEADPLRRLGAIELAERGVIMRALRDADYNMDVAAGRLSISRATIYRKMKSLGIKSPRNQGLKQRE